MEKIKIQEIIVVEGKDDVSAVKKAVDAQVITTNGYRLDKKERHLIKTAAQKSGIIILTDSDYAGETIRKRVEKLAGQGNFKHAFVSVQESTKKGDIGIENANEEAIIKALQKARFVRKETGNLFSVKDMLAHGLQGQENSSQKRAFMGDRLGIGYCNAKQFLARLNSFDIGRQEFEAISKEYEEEKDGN